MEWSVFSESTLMRWLRGKTQNLHGKVLVNISVLGNSLDHDQNHQHSCFSSDQERHALLKSVWPGGISVASGVAKGLLQSGKSQQNIYKIYNIYNASKRSGDAAAQPPLGQQHNSAAPLGRWQRRELRESHHPLQPSKHLCALGLEKHLSISFPSEYKLNRNPVPSSQQTATSDQVKNCYMF